MMEGSGSSRTHSKRGVEDGVDVRGSWNEDEEREGIDIRDTRSGKSRKQRYADGVEDRDDGTGRSSDARNQSRRKSVSSSGQTYSGDEDDYDVTRVSRASKIPRRSPEETSERKLFDGYKDRDGDSSRRRDDDDWDFSRRSSSRTSCHDVSLNKSAAQKQEMDIRYSEGRESSREKEGHQDQDEKPYWRRLDEAYSSRGATETSSDRVDHRSSSDQSKHRNTWEVHDYRNESGDSLATDYKHGTANAEEKDVQLVHQAECRYENKDNLETKDKFPYLDDNGSGREVRHDKKYSDRGHLDSDNKRSISMKEKTREDAHGDYKSYRGREQNREFDESKEHQRNSPQVDPKGPNDYDTTTEWRHGQERLENGSFRGQFAYKKDSRGRYESSKGPSSYGNRYDSSDSIEIRPNRNIDFGRGSSVSGGRTNMGSYEDFIAGTNDPGEENKSNSRNGDDSKGRYYDAGQTMDQSIGKGSGGFTTGRGGSKGPMTSDTSEADHSGSSSMISPIPQQGPKGGRPSRGVRGRPNGRDPQRMGIPMPMMPPPPFGPLGLPPGPMQPMGPNISHSPGPLGHGIFMPPFPGPLVWPGAGAVDVNMLAVPPNLHIPPVAGFGLAPNVGADASHNIQLDQTTNGTGSQTDALVSGFNPVATPSHEMLHDKPPGGWTQQRNRVPAGKAPSRGEQNDYSQNFVDTGMRPQNFIRELELTSVVEDYPKLRELIQRKDEIVSKSASAPMYYKCDLKEHVLCPEFFGTKFDVILVDPPWEEYVHRAPGITDHIEYWSPEEIMNLKIEAIADTPSFIFLWVGDGVALEQGRQCLKKWGFRRCEDICWVKTNKKNATRGLRHDSNTLFQRSKEHCLMGIKGTVRRSTDGHIIHANIDTDVIIAEEPTNGTTYSCVVCPDNGEPFTASGTISYAAIHLQKPGQPKQKSAFLFPVHLLICVNCSTEKPEDMYRIIEHFALGRRRLELFGEDHNIRPGWLTLGKSLSSSNFNKEAYIKNFADRDGKVWQGGGGRNPPPDAPHLVVTTPEIESLRPKSPPHKNQQQQQSIPTVGSSSSTSRRPATNAVTVVGSETMMPAPW
ncbi:hypothetical protein ACP70R_019195 [Stipagrostis hirtigluma subsp. patula]